MKYKRIGDYLRFDFLEKYEISQNQLAQAVNVKQNRINEIVRNRRRITPNTDLRLCKFFGLQNGYFLNIQQNMELDAEYELICDKLDEIIPYKKLRKINN